MSAQDVIDLIWKLAIALVAVVPILSVLGMWLLARFTTVFDAYAGERAKLQVQFDNVAKLVEQTRVLTATTEGIKTQLSDEIWGKQQRLLKRRETCVSVIEALQMFQQATVQVEVMHRNTQNDNSEATPEVRLTVAKQFGEAMDKYNKATDIWTHAYALAQLCCANESVRILRNFALPSLTLDNISDVMPRARLMAAKLSAQFIATARADLGYEPLPLFAITPLKSLDADTVS